MKSFRLLKSKAILLVILGIIFSLSLFKTYYNTDNWKSPLYHYGHMHHHSIYKILFDSDKYTSKDLVVQTVKNKYLIPYSTAIKWIARNTSVSINVIINILNILAILLIFCAIPLCTYLITKDVLVVGPSLFLLILNIPASIFDNINSIIAQMIGLVALFLIVRRNLFWAFILLLISSIFHYGWPVYFFCIITIYLIFHYKEIKASKILAITIGYLVIYSLININLISHTLTENNLNFNFHEWSMLIKETGWFWSFKYYKIYHILYSFILLPLSPIIFFKLNEKLVKTWLIIHLAIFILLCIHFVTYDIIYIPVINRPCFWVVSALYFTITLIFLPPIINQIVISSNKIIQKIGGILFCGFFFYGIFRSINPADALGESWIQYLISTILFIAAFVFFRKNNFNENISISKEKIYEAYSILLLMLVFISIITTIFYQKKSFKIDDPWYKTQKWALENTNDKDIFILPEEVDLFGFRIYSERSTLSHAIYEAHLVALMDPSRTNELKKQITMFWNTDIDKIVDFKDTQNLIYYHRFQFNNCKEDDFIKINKKMPYVKYVISRHLSYPSFPILYYNSNFIIYEIAINKKGQYVPKFKITGNAIYLKGIPGFNLVNFEDGFWTSGCSMITNIDWKTNNFKRIKLSNIKDMGLRNIDSESLRIKINGQPLKIISLDSNEIKCLLNNDEFIKDIEIFSSTFVPYYTYKNKTWDKRYLGIRIDKISLE